ncbi:MAG: protoporphyrinogen/coproporphyrinogen oxidase [Chthoniobacterales bacterium]
MYKKIKYLILGAGPSGLTLAHTLLDLGISREELLVLEANEEPGGLCRSTVVDGSPLDIGGGHFLDVRKKEVLDFLFRFMPREEWNNHDRVAKIILRNQEIDHPLEANLWQFTKEDQVDYLESIAQTGSVRGETMPESFIQWVRWKLGKRIADDYMLPYNHKIWSMDLNLLGTYWLYKLPDVSFREILRSCLEGKAFGALPAHGTFLYPKKYGYGEVWKRMGKALGDRLLTNAQVTKIDLPNKIINDTYQAENIITSIPWTLWLKIASSLPEIICESIEKLVNISIDVDYQQKTLSTPAHWMYEPREEIPYHRILVRSNFCLGSQGYWTECNAVRSPQAQGFRHHNEYAYPVNTLEKPKAIETILDWGRENKIYGLGRWGKWEHMNSDIAVAEAIATAEKLL